MKSWRNKVPLFFGFGAYLTLFWVPAFGTLANLEMHFFQKDLVKPIWKLAKFNLPLPKHQFKSIKPQVPGLGPWCRVWWRVGVIRNKCGWHFAFPFMFINVGMGTLYVENIFDNNAINITATDNYSGWMYKSTQIFTFDGFLYIYKFIFKACMLLQIF